MSLMENQVNHHSVRDMTSHCSTRSSSAATCCSAIQFPSRNDDIREFFRHAAPIMSRSASDNPDNRPLIPRDEDEVSTTTRYRQVIPDVAPIYSGAFLVSSRLSASSSSLVAFISTNFLYRQHWNFYNGSPQLIRLVLALSL